MLAGNNAKAPATRVTNRLEAEQLVAGVLATMGELESVLEAETAHVRVGRLRDGLAEESRKSQLAASYIQGLEAIKANAVALARFAPEALQRLKAVHTAFAEVVGTNQVVLATARAVSESLVKGIAEEMNRNARPQGYAPAGYGAQRSPSAGEPLILSKSL